jgi:diaminopimelate epimerase
MQGLGNDYIYVDVRKHPIDDPAAFSRRWSDRRTGIGSDGLILIGGSDVADFSMRIFNADGSEARMCGNGARCVGRYIHDKGLSDKTVLTLETLSGIKTLELDLDGDGRVRSVTVGMGLGLPLSVRLPDGSEGTLMEQPVSAIGQTWTASAIDVGNPHLVLLVPDAETAPVSEAGPILERDPMFPDRANIEFAHVLSPTLVRMRVWERGSGITAACGTGACATAVALASAGRIRPDGCTIRMDGGDLFVRWDPQSKEIRMTGPAETVFEGTVLTD